MEEGKWTQGTEIHLLINRTDGLAHSCFFKTAEIGRRLCPSFLTASYNFHSVFKAKHVILRREVYKRSCHVLVRTRRDELKMEMLFSRAWPEKVMMRG